MQVEKNTLSPEITRVVEKSTGKLVLSAVTLTGGLAANTKHVVLSDGSQVVVKTGVAGSSTLAVEGKMMEYVKAHTKLPIPRPFYSSPEMLVYEFVATDNCTSTLGEAAEKKAAELIAELHAITSESYGFDFDTIDTGVFQPNGRMQKWIPFFIENRLMFSAKIACEAGKIDADMMKRLESFAGVVQRYLDEPIRPSLLHGDLSSCCILCKDSKVVAFVDIGIYFGDNEMEFIYSTQRSTLSKAFFDRYNEIIPFRPGFFEVRRDIYNLYPLLIHAKVFGGVFIPRIDEILKRFGF